MSDQIIPRTVYDGLEEMMDGARRDAFRAGAEAMREAAATMLERAQQPAAALGVSLMKLPEPPK